MATCAPGSCLFFFFGAAILTLSTVTHSSNAAAKKQTRLTTAKVAPSTVNPRPKAKATRGRSAVIPPPSSSPASTPPLTASEIKALQALNKKKKDAERQLEADCVRSEFFFCPAYTQLSSEILR